MQTDEKEGNREKLSTDYLRGVSLPSNGGPASSKPLLLESIVWTGPTALHTQPGLS